MRFRKRLQMNIMPILLFAVLLVTSTVIYTSNLSIRTLQEDIMRYRLEVLYEYISTEYQTLERVNLENTKLYVGEARERIYSFISSTELNGGYFLIMNSENDLVFHTAKSDLSMPQQSSALLASNLEADMFLQYSFEGREFLAVYDYFEKWDWYIMVVADRDIIFNNVNRSVNLALVAGVSALIIAGYSLQVISKSISKPLEVLTNGTMKMKEGDYSSRVLIERSDEIGDLAGAFNDMAEEIEDNFIQIRAKSESLSLLASFAAGMAHDLKTPIGNSTTVISFMDAELVKLQAAYDSDRLKKDTLVEYLKESAESIDILTKNINHASELVTGYKTVSVDQLNREKRWIDLKEYVDEIIYTLRPKFKNTNYKVNNLVKEDLSIWTYPGALSQILTNLLVNSLVHGFDGREHGEINILMERRDGNIEMVYTDDGVGISEENLQYIYNAFFTTKHDQGGSGLGMHIIYNLVKSLLNGKVVCESALGKGVKFTIVFPDETLDS